MAIDADHSNPDIQKRLEAIYSLHTKAMDFNLDKGPYRDLLVNLGNPQNKLPPIIHLAGTNGKGSTLAFLKSICEEAGLKVHAYTSPHLIHFNERITLAGHPIDDRTLLHYLEKVEEANLGNSVTFFEYTTALAFAAMADHKADICLIETGLGGRLDCTNVIDHPMATVITSIGYDHMDWLGHTIEDIAYEKAGIMKKGVPCIISPQTYDQNIRPIFVQKANDTGCDLHCVDQTDNLPELGLIGSHQKNNAATALKTLSLTHPDISTQTANKGLKNTRWPARMEKISTIPEIWFDCGHNAEGALTIADQLKQWKADQPDRPIHLVIGLAADKDPNTFMAPLWPYCDTITCVDLPNARNAQTAQEFRVRLTTPALPVEICPAVENALKLHPDSLTLVCGSLYLYQYIK